jgi:hypothetical protein
MNSQVVRCKDIRPSFPNAFERLRRDRAQTANNASFTVENWLDQLNGPVSDSLLSRPSSQTSSSRPPGRSPLRHIQQQQRNQPARIAKGGKKQRSMADPKTGDPVKRSQRTRGGDRSRDGKGNQNAADKGPGKLQQCQTDGAAETGEKSLEDPFVETNVPLTLRSIASLPSAPMTSTSPSRSPGKSPTRTISSKGIGKAASSITKREHLANLTPAVKVYSDIREALTKSAMPKIVGDLWKNTLFPALYKEAFIPVGLEVS